jgi:hypothetical protein
LGDFNGDLGLINAELEEAKAGIGSGKGWPEAPSERARRIELRAE